MWLKNPGYPYYNLLKNGNNFETQTLHLIPLTLNPFPHVESIKN